MTAGCKDDEFLYACCCFVRTGGPDADIPDSSVCKLIWARGTHACHMRGYCPRASLKILPDSGDEPPPVLQQDNVIRM